MYDIVLELPSNFVLFFYNLETWCRSDLGTRSVTLCPLLHRKPTILLVTAEEPEGVNFPPKSA